MSKTKKSENSKSLVKNKRILALVLIILIAVIVAYIEIYKSPYNLTGQSIKKTAKDNSNNQLSLFDWVNNQLNIALSTLFPNSKLFQQETKQKQVVSPKDQLLLPLDDNDQLNANPNRFIVKFKNSDELNFITTDNKIYSRVTLKNINIKSESVKKILRNNNVRTVQSLIPQGSKLKKLENKIFTIESDRQFIPTIMNQLKAISNVEYVEYDYQVQALFIPNDPLFNEQWALNNLGQTGGLNDADIDAPEAWDITKGSSNVIISVIDTGIDYTHPDLGECTTQQFLDRQCNKVVDGYDFVNSDNDPMDDYGHGTHVAGIIAASSNNGLGISGVCPNCKIMAVKFLSASGIGYVADAILSIEYSVSNCAKILSNSWSGTGYSQALQDTINDATANGALFIASAGNTNNENSNYPAVMDNVVSVAATNYGDVKTSYSSYHNTVDLSAPGGEVVAGSSSCATGCRYPTNIAVLSTMSSGTIWNKWGSCCGIIESNVKYMGLSGTSMATPYVSGAAGLLSSLHTGWTPLILENVLKSATDNIDALNANYIGKLGTGRLNVYKALTTQIDLKLIAGKLRIAVTDDIVANNQFEPGETADLFINLINVYDYPLYSIRSVLSTIDPYVTILENDASYNTIGSGEVKENLNPFSIKLADNAPDEHTVIFNIDLNFQDGAGNKFSTTASVRYSVNYDYGWPKFLDEFGPVKSVVFSDVNGDGIKDVIAAFQGPADYLLYKIPALIAYNHEGSFLWKTTLPNKKIISDISVGDVDNDDLPEILLTTINYEWNGPLYYTPGYSLYVFENTGSIKNNWPKNTDEEEILSIPTLVDVNNDKILDIVVNIILNSLPSKVTAYNSDGSEIWTRIGPRHSSSIYNFVGIPPSPAIGDLNNDGKNEIVSVFRDADENFQYKILITNLDCSDFGYRITFDRPNGSISQPILGDIDSDGDLEIIVSTEYGDVYAYDYEGNIMSGWPKILDYYSRIAYPTVPPSLADINDDGNLEIFYFDNRNRYILGWYYNGSLISGWPVNLALGGPKSIAIADIDQDGQVEIVADSYDCTVNAFNADGSIVAGYPKRMGTPDNNCYEIRDVTLGNLGFNGNLQMVVGTNWGVLDAEPPGQRYDGLYLFDLGYYNRLKMDWPQYLHDERLTGNYNAFMCSDKTQLNQCSINKPFFCDNNRNLVYSCNNCKCPYGQVCENNVCISSIVTD